MGKAGNIEGNSAEVGRGRPLWERAVRWTVFTVAGLLVALMIAAQVALSPSVLTKAVNSLAASYIDGDLHVGKVRASVFRRFPKAGVTIDSLRITYPHERFASWDSVGISNGLRLAGIGENSADTLLSASRVEAEINLLKLLRGEYHIGRASLDGARIFAHMYDSTAANWNIFALSPSSDTTSSELPGISVGRVSLTGRPVAVFTDIRDTLFGLVTLKELDFKGKISTGDLVSSKADLNLDSLLVTGRTPSDTVSFELEQLALKTGRRLTDVSLKAKAMLGLQGLGKMDIPIALSGKVGTVPTERVLGRGFRTGKKPQGILGNTALTVKDLDLTVASIELRGGGDAAFLGDSTFIKAGASVDKCKVGDLISFLGSSVPSLKMFSTDAVVSLDASCDGFLNPARGSLPAIALSLKAPKSAIRYKGLDEHGWISLDIEAGTGDDGRLQAKLNDISLGIPGLDIDIDGTGTDLLGDGMTMKLDARVHASLESLSRMLPDSLGITAEGSLSGHVKGKLTKADLGGTDALMRSGITANLASSGLRLDAPSQELHAYLGPTDITAAPSETDGRLALKARVDSLIARYGESTFIRGRGMAAAAAMAEDGKVSGSLNFASVAMMDMDSTFVGSKDMRNYFTWSRDESSHSNLSFKTDNRAMTLRTGSTRVIASDAVFSAHASESSPQRNSARRRRLLDSLQRVYPGTPRDSLFAKMRRSRLNGPVPDFLSEKEFMDRDIDIHLGESMARLLKKWSIGGRLDVGGALVITPYYPLKNEITALKGSFDNNSIQVENLSLQSGGSDLSVKGSLTGLRRALQSKGMLNLSLNLTSDSIDANEVLAAWSAGSEFVPAEKKEAADGSIDDSDYMALVVSDALPAADTLSGKLLVLPSNLNADISLQANSVKYSTLDISWMAADIKMKERCLQATNALATSNLGDLYFEGFYSTRTKKDLKAGFDLTLVDITADKVIELIPAVDSIMPMLKTFKGRLDCELTATSAIDTNMNLVMSSINGVMNIGGKDLSLSENKVFNDLARTLRFRNRENWKVDSMEVNGIISDNVLEIFPFVLKVDRYTFALDGLQNFDQNFNYSISVLRSPLPFRFGINMKGNFDKWKWKIGKAKFKSTRVPVFTAQIDTMRVNLTQSIRDIFDKGVDAALQEVRRDQEKLDQKKEETGYSAVTEMEDLDEARKKEVEAGPEEEAASTEKSDEEQDGDRESTAEPSDAVASAQAEAE